MQLIEIDRKIDSACFFLKQTNKNGELILKKKKIGCKKTCGRVFFSDGSIAIKTLKREVLKKRNPKKSF